MASKSKKRLQKRGRVPATPRSKPPAPAARRRASAPHPTAAVAARPPASDRRQLASAPSARTARLYAYALGAAVVVGTLLIAFSQISVHRAKTAATAQHSPGIVGVADARAMLRGIPQHGNVLGSPAAPVRLIEYADPQCPYCAEYARYVLPALVREYVRTGKVQLVYRGLAFIGPDSVRALRTATASANQNRLWNVVDLIYRNQGPENAWVTDGLLREIVSGAGANAGQVFAARDGAAVTGTLDTWAALAQADGVKGVPAFFVGRRGRPLRRVELTQIATSEFRAALDGTLRR